MINIRSIRDSIQISQRQLAQISGISFRTVQLLEAGEHDAQLSTWSKLAQAFGYGEAALQNYLNEFWLHSPDSIFMISRMMAAHPKQDWRTMFFNFVDAFRKSGNPEALVSEAPCRTLSQNLQALLASTVEQLCLERQVAFPSWTEAAAPLVHPWFVSETENLKASALSESPATFRQRNIFVLDNFLKRA